MGDNRNLCPKCRRQFIAKIPADLKVLLGEATHQTGLFDAAYTLQTKVVFAFTLRCGQCRSIMASHVGSILQTAKVKGHNATGCSPRFSIVPGSRVLEDVGSPKNGKVWRAAAVLDVVCKCKQPVFDVGTDFPVEIRVRSSQMNDERQD